MGRGRFPLSGPGSRIALFGGTFDPVHQGHLVLARDAMSACGLDRVIFIPCHQSPHKKGVKSAAGKHRLAMLQLGLASAEWAEVSDLELARQGPSYSWQTTMAFRTQHPTAELFWILGADQWAVLEKWSHPEILAKHLHFIVFPREGSPGLAPRPGFRATFLDTLNPASASAIRHAIAGGAAPGDQMVHPEVADYIEEHHLYTRSKGPAEMAS